jgi:hypothetical protein
MYIGDLLEFGRVWMASSPFTQSFGPIKKGIECGVDAVVLKSCSPNVDVDKRKEQRRWVKKRVIVHPDGYCLPSVGSDEQGNVWLTKTLSCTSTGPDIELLTIEEANDLYQKIKEFSDVKVIQSFAPRSYDDFSHAERLLADAIEINPRFYFIDIPRPYLISAWQGNKPADPRVLEEKAIESGEYEEEKARKVNDLHNGVESLELGIPIIFKICREHFELEYESQLAIPVEGFTYSDSMKSGSYKMEDGCAVNRWGKGSICGEYLWSGTMMGIPSLRRETPDAFISASGGIMSEEEALFCLENGADSVQLCSAVYFDGFQKVKDIVDRVKAA